VLAAAMTGLLSGTMARANAQDPTQDQTKATDKKAKAEKHACAGKNSCKGKGGCKTSDNGCKRQELLQRQGRLRYRRIEEELVSFKFLWAGGGPALFFSCQRINLTGSPITESAWACASPLRPHPRAQTLVGWFEIISEIT